MGVNYQEWRAWANASKAFRQCQKADKELGKGNAESAGNHFGKALNYFGAAVEHLAQAADDISVKAGNLIDAGNEELQESFDKLMDGDTDGAEKHYEKALDKYDQALGLID